MPLIELNRVRKTYDLGEIKVHALLETTLNIEKGEYIALVGQSGSGKSTLMNTLGCLDRPTSGSYLLQGNEVATISRNARAAIRNKLLGFVFSKLQPAESNVGIGECRTSAVVRIRFETSSTSGASPRNARNGWTGRPA